MRKFENVRIKNTLGEGQKFINDSFSILKNLVFDKKGELIDSPDMEIVTLEKFEHEINDTEFCINLGDIEKGYRIIYQVEKPEAPDVPTEPVIEKEPEYIVQ